MAATSKELNVLLVEDSEEDAFLVCRNLEQGGFAVRRERVETEKSLAAALEQGEWDIIISDYSLPSFNGMAAYSILQASGKDIPFIIVSGTIGEETAVEAMRLGVNDYLLKGNLARLAPAVQRELLDAEGRRKSEEERARLATALEQAADIIIITDTGGNIQYVNPAFEHITGYTREESIGQNSRILKSGEHDDNFYESLWETISLGNVWHDKLTNKKRDGELFKVEATISPVKSESGKIINYMALMRDITQQVRLEAQLRQAQKMEAVGQLASGIAHDFNNILQIVRGYAQIASAQFRENDRLSSYLGTIMTAVDKGSVLTRQMLAFSREEMLQKGHVDVTSLIADLMIMLQRLIGAEFKIKLVNQNSHTNIFADRGMLEQVLMNLSLNARDAMPDGGSLIFTTDTITVDAAFRNTHQWAHLPKYLMISVSDSGSGIIPEILDKIFEPFFTTKETGKGSGLGLSMAYGIIQQHDGMIEVYSEQGIGTEFKIYLPVDIVQQVNCIESVPEEYPRGNETILVADDEQALIDYMVDVLEERGYKLITAANGEEAVDKFKKYAHEIDLVILDVVMPKLDGRRAFDLIRSIKASVPVMLSSGHSARVVDSKFIKQNEIEVIMKPYQTADLCRLVRQTLDRT